MSSPERPPPLTVVAQAAVAEVLTPGMTAIDATVGNGHDTLFLARRVGVAGRVYGFDVQQAALVATAARLRAAGMAEQVCLLQASHEALEEHLPVARRGRVGAVMFNLGYLPGGDRRCITHAASTLRGLRQALDWLAPGGLLTVLAYRGHAGGTEEADAVALWLRDLDPGRFQVRRHCSGEPIGQGPELARVTRRPNGYS